MNRLGALGRATHPEPTVAVTAFAFATALAAGLGVKSVLLGAAVLIGQASVGWSNDWLDAEIDRTAGRYGKPAAFGRLSPDTLSRAAVLALVVAILLSFSLGVRPGAVHLIALLAAWSYNSWLKPTRFSWLPYLVAFSLVPAVFVTTSLPGSLLPAWQLPLGAGLLGLAGHFANTVPDVSADALTEVRGLPQRAGPRLAMGLSVSFVSAGSLLLAWGSRWPAPMLVAAGLATAIGGLAAVLVLLDRHALAFRIVLGAAGVVVAGFVSAGAHQLGHP